MPAEVPPELPRGRLQVWTWANSDSDENVVHVLETVVGNYIEHGQNHGRKVYKKLHSDYEAFVYYWDDRDGAAGVGWWLGSEVGGDETWSHSTALCFGMEPPLTGWKIPFDGPLCDTLVVVPRVNAPEPLPSISAADLEASALVASPLPPLPQVRRLRVSLLGGNTGVQGVAKSEVASALLRGLTANWPSDRDPVLDLQFDSGVFEAAWSKLLVEDPKVSPSERWGIGPVGAWCSKVHFEKKGTWKQSPAFEAQSVVQEDTAVVYGGNPQKLNIGNEKSTGATRAFRDALSTGSDGRLDPADLENVHKELYAAAKAHPRELVWKMSPCLGVSAAFARFLPELEDLHGCGAVILEIFEPQFRPMGSTHNVAMVYAANPSNKAHLKLGPADVLVSLWAIGHNIAQTVRDYNKLADGEVPLREPPQRERAQFLRAAVESHIAYCPEALCKDQRALGMPGWMNVEVLLGLGRIIGAGVTGQFEVVEALSMSKSLETKMGEDGGYYIRVEGVDFPMNFYPQPAPEPVFGTLPAGNMPGVPGPIHTGPDGFAKAWGPPPGCPPLRQPPQQQFPQQQPFPNMVPPTMAPPSGVIPPWMMQGFTRPEFSAPDRPRPELNEPQAKRMCPQPDLGSIDLDKVCWNFAKGFCAKGAACRWGHILPPGYTGPSAATQASWRPAPTVVPPGFVREDPAAARSPAPTDEMETYSGAAPSGGARVRIVGLATRPAFNNRIAVCKGYDEAASRWEVQLEDGSILRVQEKNLRVIQEEGVFNGAGQQLSIGERVRITGLASKPSYNNRPALCKSFDRLQGEWEVLLDDGSTLNVPESNLFPY
jgi:hypothetical protein